MEGYLHLADGKTFQGQLHGGITEEGIAGEIVFFTGMTGYQEVLTDPSYKNQIIVFTYPLIGNYGINDMDFESKKPHVAAVIVHEAAKDAYHYEAKYSFTEYLKKWNIPLLEHVDTRELVKSIRQNGTMPAVLSSKPECGTSCDTLEGLKVQEVSASQPETIGMGDTHIVLIDYGFKKSIAEYLVRQKCLVTIVPYDYTFEQIGSLNPDGVLLSNGPGDPKELLAQLEEIKKVIQHYPVLGICLGHQLAALALGGDTKKMLFGHRGANQPVLDLKKNRVFMSSQNHSYAVDANSIAGTGLKVRFYNRNDQSIEGLIHEKWPLVTVQFHPEASPGPEDSAFIFEEFIQTVKYRKRREVSYA
ncbi:carbamoyl phosphate synthase small subunit [Mesobacillus subterraneus]|uniref:Carbamoyl phosphate synthase small chain n=1 Tax=Mesobacillus subterraneus TaxID=285983 RepID=A0A3R9KZ79_9BACI|nr:carbamoyl phosphate synthase small subunit [Mesobacillus subterraneus]RSD29378.1 carbamoyl phosphate synthase small subunit [Mesobacillus subterraneus]